MSGEMSGGKEAYFEVPCASCGESSFTLILKPGVTHRFRCPKCGKPTYVHISEELAIYVFSEEEKCPKCNGTGKMICPKCKGLGYYEEDYYYYGCPMCGGHGFTGDESEINVKIHRGSGKICCDECGGTGFVAHSKRISKKDIESI